MSNNKNKFEKTKDHGTTLEELKRFHKPNLDEDNRFYSDNKRIVESFNPRRIAEYLNEAKTVEKKKKKP